MAITIAAGLIAAGCGSDDEASDSESTETEADGGGDTDESGDGGDVADTTEAAGDDAGDADSDGGDRYGGSIIVGVDGEPAGWSPTVDGCSDACLTVARHVYDPLVETDANGVPQPYLAESIVPNEDASEWTITLPAGITFSNGVPLDAATLIEMLEVSTAEDSRLLGRLGNITEMTPDGDLAVTITLAGPDASFTQTLASVAGLVFEPGAFKADPVAFSENPIGTGPFVMEKWDRGSEIVLTRNADYWRTDDSGEQLPYLDGITFRPIPDEDTRLAALESGDIDMMNTYSGSTVRALDGIGGVSVGRNLGNQSTGTLLNMMNAPTDDMRVRYGLIGLSDQPGLIAVLGGEDISPPASQLVGPEHPHHSLDAAATYDALQADDEGAQAMLQEYIDDPERSDGKEPGSSIDLTLNCLPEGDFVEFAQAAQAMWSSTGQVNVEINQLESAALGQEVVGEAPDFIGSFQASCWRQGSDQDPFAFWGGEPAVGNSTNYANIYDETTDELLNQGRSTVDVDERQAVYMAFNEHMVELAPIVYAGYTVSALAHADDIAGVDGWTYPDGTPGNGHAQAQARLVQAYLTGQ
ncbi:MAG: ABC transporter substrate-binding protein [Ilumatobacter fluminis]|uniref:ABC transporter substrate-binding protein n=1 Tax=Ilumatobacter fluminis TaxID=467091 RepID=UPI0032EBA221